MEKQMPVSQTDWRDHIPKIRGMLATAASHSREDVDKVHDPKAKALFETTAEVLDGLIRAYDHAEKRSEPAWK